MFKVNGQEFEHKCHAYAFAREECERLEVSEVEVYHRRQSGYSLFMIVRSSGRLIRPQDYQILYGSR